MNLKKSKKKLKKTIARLRMKRVQMIMNAMRIHSRITQNVVKTNKKPKGNAVTVTNRMIKNKITKIKGRIATSKSKSRDLWRGKSRSKK